ncbi:hypothetical protein ABW21_db0202573 [Orbilia brochopaga]|nr:hypothetical protein ABW21_db0202573 [Drechslerella brochopaga]
MQSHSETHPTGNEAASGAIFPPASIQAGATQTPHRHGRHLKTHVTHDWRNQKVPAGLPFRAQSPHHGSRGRPGYNRWIQETGQYRYEEPDVSYTREAWKATGEGRRLYFGNLDWHVTAADVAIWLEGAGHNMRIVDMPAQIEAGVRRPLFCFVEFYTAEETEMVRTTLNGRRMRGRPIKIDVSKPKNARVASTALAEEIQTPSKLMGEPATDLLSVVSTPITAPTANIEGKNIPAEKAPESTRLFVGGLPQIENVNELEDLMAELFVGFNVGSLSEVMAAKKPKFAQDEADTATGNYCFVDVANISEAKMAVRFLNNRETSWGTAHVRFAAGGTEGKLKYCSYENIQPKQDQEGKEEVEIQEATKSLDDITICECSSEV